MLAEKTVLLPVSTDEAFALITEPDRLRRWKTVSAVLTCARAASIAGP